MDIDITKNPETNEPVGMMVSLSGTELTEAILGYMAKEGVKCHTTPDYVSANCEVCDNAVVILAKEDIVELSPTWQEKLNIKDPSEKSTACVVGDWIRSI